MTLEKTLQMQEDGSLRCSPAVQVFWGTQRAPNVADFLAASQIEK